MKNLELISEIASRLLQFNIEIEGVEKVIEILPCEHGDSMNHLKFFKKVNGVYFYYNTHDLDSIMMLRGGKFEVLVCIEGSKKLFKVS